MIVVLRKATQARPPSVLDVDVVVAEGSKLRRRRAALTGLGAAAGSALSVALVIGTVSIGPWAQHARSMAEATSHNIVHAPGAGPAAQGSTPQCPDKPPVMPALTNTPPGKLAPTDASQGVLCRYAGLNDTVPGGTLTKSIRVPNAASLARALNEATPIPYGKVFHCPEDDGGVDAVVLASVTGTPVVIEVRRTDCEFATSTQTTTSFWLSGPALAALQALDPTLPWGWEPPDRHRPSPTIGLVKGQ
jgi:hypothetical protein